MFLDDLLEEFKEEPKSAAQTGKQAPTLGTSWNTQKSQPKSAVYTDSWDAPEPMKDDFEDHFSYDQAPPRQQ